MLLPQWKPLVFRCLNNCEMMPAFSNWEKPSPDVGLVDENSADLQSYHVLQVHITTLLDCALEA